MWEEATSAMYIGYSHSQWLFCGMKISSPYNRMTVYYRYTSSARVSNHFHDWVKWDMYV